jgi:hypothetical protein
VAAGFLRATAVSARGGVIRPLYSGLPQCVIEASHDALCPGTMRNGPLWRAVSGF